MPRCLCAEIIVASGWPGTARQTCIPLGGSRMTAGASLLAMWNVPGIRRSVLLLIRGAALIAAVSCVCYRAHLNSASTALVFLVVVMLHSLDCNFVDSASVSLLAVGSLDFFFIEPRFSLTVARPSDVVTLGCLLTLSLTVTRLQARIRAEAEDSKVQRENTARLYSLSQELLGLDPGLAFGPAMLQPIVRHFEVKGVCVFDAAALECHAAGVPCQELEERTRDAYVGGRDFDEREPQICVRCLWIRGKLAGTVGFEGLNHASIAIAPLTSATAAALERARAFRAATTAAAQAQAEALRSAILDALAHEIKTPLSAIMTAAGGIRSTKVPDGAQGELAGLIESEASRLSELTSRLLRIARLDNEEIRPRLEHMDAAEIAEPLARRYARLWPDRHVSFRGRDCDVELRADRDLISLALSQLLENACRYSQPDANVVVEASCDSNTTAFTVLNDGDPIPAPEHSRVFERFYRGTDARRLGPGTGLGLYVARKIALAHGGDITVVDVGPSVVAFRLSVPAALASEVSIGD
jgi:two-component system, OmpR family, sensor histidine kinase KdpD